MPEYPVPVDQPQEPPPLAFEDAIAAQEVDALAAKFAYYSDFQLEQEVLDEDVALKAYGMSSEDHNRQLFFTYVNDLFFTKIIEHVTLFIPGTPYPQYWIDYDLQHVVFTINYIDDTHLYGTENSLPDLFDRIQATANTASRPIEDVMYGLQINIRGVLVLQRGIVIPDAG